MGENYFVVRDLHRRRYSFNRTKTAVMFCLSVLFSVFLGGYFDRYGPRLLGQATYLLFGDSVEIHDYEDHALTQEQAEIQVLQSEVKRLKAELAEK